MLTEVKAADYTVRGVSVGGVYTSLYVPELGSMFDVGVAPRSFVGAKRLFLSHGHVDHSGAMASFLGTRALCGVKKPLTVYLPAEIEEPMVAALTEMTKMQRWDLIINAVPVKPGDVIELTSSLSVRAFRTYHPVPSLGYQLFRRIDKLKPEFADLPGPEIGMRRKRGDDIFDRVERRELAYATDTLARVLDNEPELLSSRVLILECTFLDDKKSLEGARAGCHIHLDELIERAEQFDNEALVLMHFSQLYSPREVHRLLANRCPPPLRDRIVVFAPDSGPWPG